MEELGGDELVVVSGNKFVSIISVLDSFDKSGSVIVVVVFKLDAPAVLLIELSGVTVVNPLNKTGFTVVDSC